jgi:hypothetical protein
MQGPKLFFVPGYEVAVFVLYTWLIRGRSVPGDVKAVVVLSNCYVEAVLAVYCIVYPVM